MVPSDMVQQQAAVASEDDLRAEMYILLAMLLAGPPSAEVLKIAAGLKGDDGDFGRTVAALSASAKSTTLSAVSDEYHELFIGMEHGELIPYASYYRTGALYTRPLAVLRVDMARLGIIRADKVNEPEDHIAALCEMMAGLIMGAFGAQPNSLAVQHKFFEEHLLPWAPRFFGDLEAAQAASFYMPVGGLGRCFLEIEQQAFQMA